MIKLAFIAFGCEDIEKSKLFYEKLFDIQFVKECHENGKEHYAVRFTDITIELFKKEDLKEPILFGYGSSFISRATSPEGHGISCKKICAYCNQLCYVVKEMSIFGPVNYCSPRCYIALSDLLDGVPAVDVNELWCRMANKDILIKEANQRCICHNCGDDIPGHIVENKWTLDQHTCK